MKNIDVSFITKTFKILKKIFILCIALIVLFYVCLYAYCVYVMCIETKRIDSCDSPNGEYKLIFDHVGSSLKDPGSGARFKLKKGIKTIEKCKVSISTNPLTPENWDVKWYDDRVEIFVLPEAASSEPNPIILYFDE